MSGKALYKPPDLEKAQVAWQATSGPIALAAIMRRPVASVLPFFVFPEKRYTTRGVMEYALDAAKAAWRKQWSGWPYYGLVFLQIEGPWCGPGLGMAARYLRTHWIGYSQMEGEYVFDDNAAGWLPCDQWEREVMPAAVTRHEGATGWRVWTAFSVLTGREASK